MIPTAAATATGPPRHRHRFRQPLQSLDDHHGGGHQDQHRIDQRGQLGAAAVAVGEARCGRPGAEPFGAPAEQQTGDIAEIVDRIADQGQRTEGQANRQLQSRQSAVEDDAPAKGRR